MVIEQIPLALVVHNAVVVGPAAVGMLGHDEAFVFVGTHRVLTHGVAEHLGVLPHIRIGQVVIAVVLEGERAFSLTVGQVLEAVHAHHLEFALTPLHFLLRSVVGEFLHIILELGATSGTPEDIGVAVGCLQHAGVDAVDALDGLRLGNERSFGAVGDGYTNTEATHASSRSRGEVEIVFAVSVDAVGRPHRIGVWSYPGHFVLSDNHTMVGPVGQILGREHMIVGHAEPVLALALGREDIM